MHMQGGARHDEMDGGYFTRAGQQAVLEREPRYGAVPGNHHSPTIGLTARLR